MNSIRCCMKAILNALGDAEIHRCGHMVGNRGSIFGYCVLRELFRMGSHRTRDFGTAMKKRYVNA